MCTNAAVHDEPVQHRLDDKHGSQDDQGCN